jgi:hypothetical protein
MGQVEEGKPGGYSICHRLSNHVFYGMKHSRKNVTFKEKKGICNQVILVWRILIGLPTQRRSNTSN